MANLNIATENTETAVRRAVTCSFGFGGHNAALLLGAVPS